MGITSNPKRRSLFFLGTGAGDANFSTAESANLLPKDVRRFCSHYLTPDILIDFNEHTIGALNAFGVERRSIRHLLVSHGHYDHFNPVEILRFAETLPHPLVVYGNTMVRDALEFCRRNRFDAEAKRFVEQDNPFNIVMDVISPGMSTEIEGCRIAAVLANHFMNKHYCIMEQQALNFVLETGGKTIFYGLDSSYLLPETQRELARFRFDFAILDATFGPLEINPLVSGHLNWKMLDETITEFRDGGMIDDATVIVASHVSCENVKSNDEIADGLAKRGITLAFDGLRIPL